MDATPGDVRVRAPAMIAGMADSTGAIRGVHATYLRRDGSGKADLSPARKMWGPLTGHAVWLAGAPSSERTHPLVSGEGIETVWGFIQRWGRPCRAAASLSLDNLQGFPLTPGGALPLWNPRIDPDRRCFTLSDPGDVVVLVDADMKPLRDRRVQLARGKRSEISDDHGAGAGATVRDAGDATVATGRGAAGRGDPAANRHGLQRFGARCSMSDTEGMRVLPWSVTVRGYPDFAVYFAASRGKAIADAWRCDAFDNVSFGDFLRMVTCRRAEPNDRFGERFTISGRPARYVSHNRQYVQFTWEGEEAVLNTHPLDIDQAEARRGTPYYQQVTSA
ncbi:DUF7146 domain-containing protein [Sphingomonas panni]